MFVLFLLVGRTVTAGPQHDSQENGDEQIQELDQKISGLISERDLLLEQVRQTRIRAADQDRDLNDVFGQIDRIESLKKEIEGQRVKSAKALDELEKAKVKLKEAEESLESANKQAEQAGEQLADTEKQLETLLPKLPELNIQASGAKLKTELLHHEIEQLENQSNRFDSAIVGHRSEIERRLRSNGQWVSFKDQIAPIFQNRCVPCHNVRNAQGRYNMATYSATLSPGESGLAVEPGDAELSPIYQFVVDGWMPFEADALPDEEILLIRKWIDLGARLDLDVQADEPLIRIMPRTKQPMPPESYSAMIPVTSLAVSPDGKRLASSGYHEVLIWDVPGGELVRRISGIAERVYGIDFHPDGEVMAVASGTPGRVGEVKLFNLVSGEMVADLLVSEDVVFDVAFSPDGDRVATAAADGSVTIVDLASDFAVTSTLWIEDHADWVTSVCWSPDGLKLVTASRDQTCKLFDANSGKLELTFSEHQKPISTAVFSSNGKMVASGGEDEKVKLWSVNEGKQLQEIGGFVGAVNGLMLDQNQQIIVTDASGGIGTIEWSGAKLQRRATLEDGWPSSLTLSHASDRVFIGNQAGRIQSFRLDDLQAGPTWFAVP